MVTAPGRDAPPLRLPPAEADDLTPLAQHMAELADHLEQQITPVMEDDEAGTAISQGIG